MYRYLPHATADFTAEILSVRPTTILPHTGDKKQIIHEFDDGSVSAVGISTSNFFTVQLQWSYISPADYRILMDFWFSASKAAGRTRTFYWEHPVTGMVYVARFMGPLTPAYNNVGHLSVNQITLRIEGVYSVLVNLPLYDNLSLIAGDGPVTFSRNDSVGTNIDRNGDIQNLSANEPGFDAGYIGLPCASTNILNYSQDFSDAVWVKTNVTCVADDAVAPDRTTTANKIVENTDNISHYTNQVVPVTANIPHVFSVFAKASEREVIQLVAANVNGDSAGVAAINLTTGEYLVEAAFSGLKVLPLANGWYRIEMPITPDLSTLQVQLRIADTLKTAVDGHQGDGTSGLYIWGAQVEALPFATPYIKTLGEAGGVARLASTLTIPYAGNFPGSLADKTILFDVRIMGYNPDTYEHAFYSGDLYISISAGNVNSRVYMDSNNYTPIVSNPSDCFRIGMTYDSATATLRMYHDGILVSEKQQANSSLAALSDITLGGSAYIKIKNLLICNKALTEQEMLREYQS